MMVMLAVVLRMRCKAHPLGSLEPGVRNGVAAGCQLGAWWWRREERGIMRGSTSTLAATWSVCQVVCVWAYLAAGMWGMWGKAAKGRNQAAVRALTSPPRLWRVGGTCWAPLAARG